MSNPSTISNLSHTQTRTHTQTIQINARTRGGLNHVAHEPALHRLTEVARRRLLPFLWGWGVGGWGWTGGGRVRSTDAAGVFGPSTSTTHTQPIGTHANPGRTHSPCHVPWTPWRCGGWLLLLAGLGPCCDRLTWNKGAGAGRFGR